jgi:hypothetical protein
VSAEIIPISQAAPVNATDTALSAVVHLIHIRNPLMPATSREDRTLPCEPFKTVRAYLDDAFPGGHELLTVSLNGRVLQPVEQEHVIPRAGDWLAVSPMVAGGGVWRTLAQVALMATVITLAILFPPSILLSIASGAIMVGGNLLINAYLPAMTASKAQQPSWAFSGPQTTAQPGIVVPKGYGTFMGGGNIISSFVDLEGSNQYINALVCYGFGPARSITGIQINGKDVSTYSDVQVVLRYGSNDQTAIPAFNRIVNGYPQETQVTCSGGSVIVPGTGDLTQAMQVDIMFATGVFYISGDGNQLPCKVVYQVEYAESGTYNWQPVLQPRTKSDVVIYHSDGTVNTDDTPKWGLQWNGCAPNSGILIATDNGPHTAGDQHTLTELVVTYDMDGSSGRSMMTFTGEWQPIDTALNQIMVTDWMNGWVQYVDDTTEVVYNRTSIYGLAPGKYDVRVTKWGSNNADNTIEYGDNDSPHRGQEVWIHSVNEITYQDLSYPNMILVGVRALATNQLSGSNINITAVIEYGLRTLDNNLLPAALQAFEEDNPACVAADMMLDPLYGGGSWPGIQPTNIERFIDEWVTWAEANDTLVSDGNGNSIRLNVFNGIFDNEDNLWNQLQAIGRMSRACIIPMGRDYGVFVNQADVPVQMFSVGNIVQDSFEETWLALDERANQVEVEFADSTRYYRTDNPLVYMDPAAQAAGAIVKNVRIRGTGITHPAQAWHYGHFLGLSNDLLLRTGKFQCDVEAIACRPGNLVILQHDVPQWGWGGRTLPGATTTDLPVDRDDLPWDGTTAYNVIVQFPSIQRYAGTVSAVNADTDSTGLSIGTLVSLSSFDNANRVTRAVINGQDCAILSAAAGQVLVTPPPGFTPVVGQAYVLYDTDVMLTSTVVAVAPGPNNTQILTLGTGFSQAPQDFSTYFYGEPGSEKIVRVVNIRKASEFRSTIEWIDYDPDSYTAGTPVVGETSAQVTTKPGVTNLTAKELYTLESGSYVDYASLSWKNGTNTAGVAIYGSYPGGSVKMLARLTGTHTAWKYQVSPGVAWTFIVVGFDSSDNYAAFSTAPSVTMTAIGVTTNLLLGSSFQSGFAYWNTSPRASDTLVASLADDGIATYTAQATALTVAQTLLSQVIVSGKWQAGTLLMLSAYFETTGALVGNLVADIAFYNSSSAIISTARAVLTMAGAASNLTRVNTAATAVPTGTALVAVRILVDGSTLSIPAGSTLAASHLLLEVADAGQTAPSTWADIDVKGNVTDVFQTGSSSSLRTQASTLPMFTGQITYNLSSTSATLSWASLVIGWPDGGYTYILDGSLAAVTGLTAGTKYWAFLYWDVINAAVVAVAPASAVGTPAILSTTYDTNADAACHQDGRVPLTPGGISFTTTASGTSVGSGGGSGSGGGTPYRCTVRGTVLQTSIGPVRNDRIKLAFDLAEQRGRRILLRTPSGRLEAIKQAEWITVDHHYWIEVEGFSAFGASGSHTLFVEGDDRQRWCSQIPEGSRVATVKGFRPVKITRIDRPVEVLHIELDGPDHRYLTVEGVLTHNMKMQTSQLLDAL